MWFIGSRHSQLKREHFDLVFHGHLRMTWSYKWASWFLGTIVSDIFEVEKKKEERYWLLWAFLKKVWLFTHRLQLWFLMSLRNWNMKMWYQVNKPPIMITVKYLGNCFSMVIWALCVLCFILSLVVSSDWFCVG